MLSTIDDFLKIFRFYRNNPIRTLREKFTTNTILYEDSIDVFLNSIVWDTTSYPSSTTLQYPDDETTVQAAINAREDLAVYFDRVLFPGSYAFVTNDNKLFKSLLLDWSSSLKTIQDLSKQVTNAYALNSEDTDKAIRGFGIDFINSYTVPSLTRRQSFLLSMCELYKIKGTPASIVKALNIIGMANVYIREAWVVPTKDGKEDIEIEWRQVKQQQVFDESNNKYINPYEAENTYMDWGWFDTKIKTFIGDPHWFYTKEEIVNLNWGKYVWTETSSGETLVKLDDVWMKLPSITPYFSIEFFTDSQKQNAAYSALISAINDQYQLYLDGKFGSIRRNLSYGSFSSRISAIQCYCAVIYSYLCLDIKLRYDHLRTYLESAAIEIDVDLSTSKNKFIDLIYWLYLKRKNPSSARQYNLFNSAIENYVALKNNGYCSYDDVLYWWITKRYGSDEDIELNPLSKTIIQPTGGAIEGTNDYAQLYWEEEYPYGYYDIEAYSIYEGWMPIYTNQKINSKYMQRIIPLDINGVSAQSADVSNFRIVHYRTKANLPQIFFGHPFYFDPQSIPTDLNRVQLYNYIDSTPEYYENVPALDLIFRKENIVPTEDATKSREDLNSLKADVESNLYSELYNKSIRLTDIDTQRKSYYNSWWYYPKGVLLEDKNIQISSSLYEYVSWVSKKYTDTITHDGSKLWNYNLDSKWPINKKWNWAASGKNEENKNFYLWNYEASKWLRVETKLESQENVPEDSDYGVVWFKNNKLYVKVSESSEMVIDSDTTLIETEWNPLQWEEKEEIFNNEEDRANRIKFLENLSIYPTTYEILDENNSIASYNLKYLSPPSDIYPSSALPIHKYENEDVMDYFSDTLIKTNSIIAKQIVTDKISQDKAIDIYEQAASLLSNSNEDNVSENLNSQRIEVQHDPFYSNKSKMYTYHEFLEYLYLNRLTLDINTGYIYRPFDFYLDQYGYMYVKCREENENLDINTKWVRFKIELSWSKDETRESIYNDEVNLGKILPNLGFLKTYDAERFLDGPVYKSTDLYTAEEIFQKAIDSDKVPDTASLVLLLDKNGFEDSDLKFKIKVKRNQLVYDEDKDEYSIADSWVDEDKLTDENGEIIPNLPSRIFDVNFGIGEDLLDYINALYEVDDENYVEVPKNLMQTLTDYLQEDLGWEDVNLDFNISYFSSNKVTREIIKFYKPKRARMLYLAMNIFGDNLTDVYDGLMMADLTNNHIDLNNWLWNMPKYNTHERSGGNMTRITQQILDYVPFDDLHFAKNNSLYTEIWNTREMYMNTDKVPSLECYDRITKLNDVSIILKQQTINPTFYTNYYDDNTISGFYFRIPGSKSESKFGTYTYTNNNYYFIRTRFQYRTEQLNVLNRWFIFSIYDSSHDLENCLYVSEENVSSEPWSDLDGNPIKYMKFEKTWKPDEIEDHINNSANYIYGIFQTDNIVKINLRYLEPSVYFNCFDDDRFNGYYYYDYVLNKKRNGQITYFNQSGKMISYLDYSYVSKNYIQHLISETSHKKSTDNKFWIISDSKEIIDLSDATYIAYDLSPNPTIFDNDNYQTKEFYKVEPKLVGNNKKPIFVESFKGYHINTVLDDFDSIVCKKDQMWYRLSDPLSYKNILFRRTSINEVPVRYEPSSYINFNYNSFLLDYYENATVVHHLDTNEQQIPISKKYYCMNRNGYEFGAFRLLENENKLLFDFSSVVSYDYEVRASEENKYWTIFFRFKFNDESKASFDSIFGLDYNFDLNWHTIAINQSVIKSSGRTNLYKNIYVDGKKYIDDTEISSDDLITQLIFEEINVDLCEFAVYSSDEEIPSWYHNIIDKFGCIRERFEPNKSETSIGPRNFRPLYAINEPRTVFGRWCTGVPENIQGDRVRSTKWNPLTQQFDFYPYSTTKSIDGGELTDRDEYGDPWNADSKHYPDQPQEINYLWRRKIENEIYDREVKLLTRDSNVVGFEIGNRYYQDTLIKDGAISRPQRDAIDFGQGVNYSVPSNYVAGFNVPIWWVPSLEDPEYKTGSIHHRPLYISIKESKDDVYPIIGINEDCGEYFDSNLIFDGKSNIDNSIYNPEDGFQENHICDEFNENKYDFNTKYALGYNVKIDRIESKTIKIENGKKEDGEYDYIEKDIIVGIIEKDGEELETATFNGIQNIRNNADTYCKSCDRNTNYIQDLDQLQLSEQQKKSGIYHKTIYTTAFSGEYQYLDGTWRVKNRIDSFEDSDFACCYENHTKNSELVLTRQKSGYYWWEIRTKQQDGTWKKICRTFVKPKINLSRTMVDYDYINELQIDVCNQKLCWFNRDENNEIQDYKQFETLDYDSVPQTIMNSYGFNCNKWVSLDLKPTNIFNHLPAELDNFITSVYVTEDRKTYSKLYVNVLDRWYWIDCEIYWDDDEIVTPYTEKVTSSGFLWRNGYLYIYIHDNQPVQYNLFMNNRQFFASSAKQFVDKYVKSHSPSNLTHVYWVRIKTDYAAKVSYLNKPIYPWTIIHSNGSEEPQDIIFASDVKSNVDPFGGLGDRFNGWSAGTRLSKILKSLIQIPIDPDDENMEEGFFMNVLDSSHSDSFDNSYICEDIVDIRGTIEKLRKYNGKPPFYNTFGKEWINPKEPDQLVGYRKETLKDYTEIYMYYYCPVDTRCFDENWVIENCPSNLDDIDTPLESDESGDDCKPLNITHEWYIMLESPWGEIRYVSTWRSALYPTVVDDLFKYGSDQGTDGYRNEEITILMNQKFGSGEDGWRIVYNPKYTDYRRYEYDGSGENYVYYGAPIPKEYWASSEIPWCPHCLPIIESESESFESLSYESESESDESISESEQDQSESEIIPSGSGESESDSEEQDESESESGYIPPFPIESDSDSESDSWDIDGDSDSESDSDSWDSESLSDESESESEIIPSGSGEIESDESISESEQDQSESEIIPSGSGEIEVPDVELIPTRYEIIRESGETLEMRLHYSIKYNSSEYNPDDISYATVSGESIWYWKDFVNRPSDAYITSSTSDGGSVQENDFCAVVPIRKQNVEIEDGKYKFTVDTRGRIVDNYGNEFRNKITWRVLIDLNINIIPKYMTYSLNEQETAASGELVGTIINGDYYSLVKNVNHRKNYYGSDECIDSNSGESSSNIEVSNKTITIPYLLNNSKVKNLCKIVVDQLPFNYFNISKWIDNLVWEISMHPDESDESSSGSGELIIIGSGEINPPTQDNGHTVDIEIDDEPTIIGSGEITPPDNSGEIKEDELTITSGENNQPDDIINESVWEHYVEIEE